MLPAVPLRQWVLTLPFELRAALAYERNLMGAVARIFADSVMGWYRRRLAEGVPEARGGAVTVIQRCSSDMKLNPHLHVILVDGAYVPGPDGVPSFRALPRLATDEVGDVLQVARVRILRYLARRGVLRLLPEAALEMDVLSLLARTSNYHSLAAENSRSTRSKDALDAEREGLAEFARRKADALVDVERKLVEDEEVQAGTERVHGA